MTKLDTKRELEALLKTAEENRAKLDKSWKKVEDLEAAIDAARQATAACKLKQKSQ